MEEGELEWPVERRNGLTVRLIDTLLILVVIYAFRIRHNHFGSFEVVHNEYGDV